MKRVTLVARRDEANGELGLMIRGATGYQVNSAAEGLLIAHDLIEHQNGLEPLGRIDDELEALGAIWMCRGRWGMLNKTGAGSAHSIEENIASDVTRMFVDYVNGDDSIHWRKMRTTEHDHDISFKEIIEIGRRDVAHELQYFQSPMYGERVEQLDDYYKLALHLMRTGARKLMRRYPGKFAANNMFWAIAEAVDGVTARDLVEGAEYVLTYGYRDGNWDATCEEYWEEPY